MAFLSGYDSYFAQAKLQKEFSLKNLIADPDFKEEFIFYRKEAIEVTAQPSELALLSPILQEAAINYLITEMGKLQAHLKENGERLPECFKTRK